MHKDLVLEFIKRQALLITPIAPHWAEYIWKDVLKNVSRTLVIPLIQIYRQAKFQQSSTIQNELFPKVSAPISLALTAARNYVHAVSTAITSTEGAQLKKKAKGKGTTYDPSLPKKLTIFVALTYPGWQNKYIDLVREAFDEVTLTVNDKELNLQVQKLGETKKAMPFVQGLKRRLQVEPSKTVFKRKLVFDEVETLKQVLPMLKKNTGCQRIDILIVEDGGKELSSIAENAEPGNPKFEFMNIST